MSGLKRHACLQNLLLDFYCQQCQCEEGKEWGDGSSDTFSKMFEMQRGGGAHPLI